MSRELPEVGAVVGPLLSDVEEAHRPFVIAYVERVAAGRYRAWAAQVDDSSRRERLLACAEREETIASRVEALSPKAVSIQEGFAVANPDLQATYDELFAGRPLAQQMQIQANAERLGAATWRALAAVTAEPARAVLASCALLEEASAEELERLIADGF